MYRKKIDSVCRKCGIIFRHRTDHPNKYCSRQCAGIARRHQIKCKHCGKKVNMSRNKFCSIKCMNLDKTSRTVKTMLCDECGVVFSKPQCHITKNNFCSKECRNDWQSGENHPKSKPLMTEIIRTDSCGRQRAWVKVAHPNVWVQRARYLVEQFGTIIPKGRIVHHRDKDTLNDSLINLIIVTRKWHINCHRKELEVGRKR